MDYISLRERDGEAQKRLNDSGRCGTVLLVYLDSIKTDLSTEEEGNVESIV